MIELSRFILSSKLQSLLFFLLVLFIPTQFGRHFWPNFAFILGQRVDYLSPTIYFTDILILLFIFVSYIKFLNSSKSLGRGKLNHFFSPAILMVAFSLLLIAVGIFISEFPLTGWYAFFKLLEFILLAFAAKSFLSGQENTKIIVYPLLIGLIFESLIAIWQFVQQSSIGGLFYFFGERTFNGDTPGIANTSLNGQLLLRPYATFPHPNVLAAYLVISMILILINYPKDSYLKKIILVGSLLLGSVALLMSFSRIAIISWFIAVLYFIYINIKRFKLNRNQNRLFIIGSIILFIISGALFFMTPLRYRFLGINLTDESITQRIQLFNASIKMTVSRPLFGVGFGNFMPELGLMGNSYKNNSVILLQPVHNIFLLLAAEIGITGLIIIFWLLFKTIKNLLLAKNNDLLFLLGITLLLGQFDHYFLTIQQGQLLLTFVLIFCWGKKSLIK